MNVIIPLGGLGTRFQKEGYARPKPFVRVLGKEMILWIVEHLRLGPDDSLVIVFNPAFLSMDVYMTEMVQNAVKDCTLVELAGPTRGAAETVLLGLKGLSKEQRNRPCMLCDGDVFFTADIVSMYRPVSVTHNATFTFHDTQPKPIYSYVTIDKNDDVIEIKEKIKISDHANSGAYCFRNGCELEKYCEQIIEKGAVQLSQDMKGEFYTSGVIAAMLVDKIPCKKLELQPNSFHVLGTPLQLNNWCVKWFQQDTRIIVFGLMGTLVQLNYLDKDKNTTDSIKKMLPIKRNFEYCNNLYTQGHYIIISCTKKWIGMESKIRSKLDELGLKYSEINCNGPAADYFVDCNAIDAIQGTLESQIGYYYPTDVKCSSENKNNNNTSLNLDDSTFNACTYFTIGALVSFIITKYIR